MDFLKTIEARLSVRNFKNDPVDKSLIEKIIDTARLAPTARNIQPWKFVVITNKDIRLKIAQLALNGPFIKDAPVCIAVLCSDTKYYLEDGCAATQNILLAVTNFGLGGCWVAGDKKEYADDVLKLVGADNKYKLVSLIAVGYPAQQNLKPHSRKSLNEVLCWEKI